MRFSPKQYAQALMDSVAETDPKQTDQVLDNFAKTLAENNDLRLFDEIAEEFHKLELAQKGIKQAEVTSAHPLTRENEKQIVDELNRLTKSKVELKKKIDERILGGIVVKLDDKILDASVHNQLEQLKQELTK